MAIVFGAAPRAANKSNTPVLAPAFARDLLVMDETEADSGNYDGFRVVTNYRGFTKDKAGRKSGLIHQTVVDLSPLGTVIPLAELDDAIARLSAMRDEIREAGVLGGKGDPTAK